MCYVASTKSIVLRSFTATYELGLSLMCVNFTVDLINPKYLKILLFHRYLLNYTLLPFLSMAQVRFYKTFLSKPDHIMVYV